MPATLTDGGHSRTLSTIFQALELPILVNPVTLIGRTTLNAINTAGTLTLFLGEALGQLVKRPMYFRLFLRQCELVGVNSLPIVLLTAIFTGGVLALQSFRGFDNATIAAESVGTVVALSMLRELGPVLASLMVAGRVGASMAAEIGTMRVTEQIDALVTLATNPMKYLVLPRILALAVMMPLLAILANVVGIFGGYLVATKSLGLNAYTYIDKSFASVQFADITLGLVKAFVFGIIIALMGCYHGYTTRGGAEGVGRATTTAVVYASVMILVTDYLLTALMF
ncbi:MAG: MlaE family lipid ABC transporter permease subunit [Proteobacteria bacterium]|nr:MlaE family lipid ABC transporter permease subunit [Pseudomonadota bacterium]